MIQVFPSEVRVFYARSFPLGRLGNTDDIAGAAILALRWGQTYEQRVLDVNGGLLIH